MDSKAPSNYNPITQYGAWIVLGVVLLGAAQFDTTAQLAAGFAYLILVAAILWYGENAIANIQHLLGNTPGGNLLGGSGGSGPKVQ
jgi:hypothetical protein